MHLGHGEWLIVDSCIAADRTVPVLTYLQQLGVDPSSAVKLVVATQWHDDNIRGISQVMAACKGASFVWSKVLEAEGLLAHMFALASPSRIERFGRLTTGVNELSIALRMSMDRPVRPRMLWASAGGIVYERSGQLPARVYTLTPTSDALRESSQDIALLLAQGEERGRVPRPRGSSAAVVVWIEVGGAAILLGSDFDDPSNTERGWASIAESSSGGVRRADIFKVPLQGSLKQQPSVWRELLVPLPQILVCPSRVPRPGFTTVDDMERLCELGQVHVTTPVMPVEAIPAPVGRAWPAIPPFGRITLRRRSGVDDKVWSASYAEPAGAACDGRSG